MCGIAGIIGHINGVNRAALKRMNEAMIHRGPDGEGYWESPPDSEAWGVMLAHRRLSILDLSPTGNQPMVDAVTGHVIALNGEIYNYAELRNQLAGIGHSLQSTGDTAVMLKVLSVHGHQAVSWLRGMFAFAFWNINERKLVLARDPLGIKPLYFARNPDPNGEWSVAFASELRALLDSGLLGKPRLNPLAVASMTWNGFIVSPQTTIIGIESVGPGQLRTFDTVNKIEEAKYFWSIPQRDQMTPMSEAEIRREFEHCVKLHMASDVPLGIFLSGGVDSSAVANLAQMTSQAPVHTFTLAFEEQEFNEGPIARRIAEAIGARHQEVVLSEKHFISNLDAALDSLDQPTFDGLNSYYMSHAVRQAGFKVALVGTGGDELFGGYTSFRDLPKLFQLSMHTKWMPKRVSVALASLLSSLLQPSFGSISQQTRWAKLPEMIRCGEDLLSLYQLAYALFLPDFQRQLLGREIQEMLIDGLPSITRSLLLNETQSRSPLSTISVLEQRLFLGERLLPDTDAASMSASIEVRLPLVDHVLLENLSHLPDSQRYSPLGKKTLLRRIGLNGLDPALFNRPKSGFVLPFNRWLRTGLGKVMDQTMRDPVIVKPTGLNPDTVRRLWQAFSDGQPGIYWTRVWAIYVLIRWCHRHGAYL